MSLLEITNVGVSYGGNVALSNVNIDVEEGKLTGLIGPNGAGKTTLFNAVCGLLSPNSGSISIDGMEITKLATHKRARLGMARTFQRMELFTSLTVYENILVAAEIARRLPRGKGLKPAKEAARVMELLGLTDLAEREVSEIPTGKSRIVEVGRALVGNPKLLLLDEPASGQTEAETTEFGKILRKLTDEGMTTFLVEHDMNLVMDVCDTIYVLDFGEIIAHDSPSKIQTNPAVLSAYLGTE